MHPSEQVGYRYYLRGYDGGGDLRFQIPSSRKHLTIARSIFDLGGPAGGVGRWKIVEEMWPELAYALDWPERQGDLEYFIESDPVDG
ncbi:hypothetical protein [Catenulispora pinisilvae]|uniref:hypothetical protein n=1 Tax=Catenulispora pinisilvae TaxID=2705253 RepID=UPI0018910F1F|nr:hypothetical protein [Catenulispora pinisilvae]